MYKIKVLYHVHSFILMLYIFENIKHLSKGHMKSWFVTWFITLSQSLCFYVCFVTESVLGRLYLRILCHNKSSSRKFRHECHSYVPYRSIVSLIRWMLSRSYIQFVLCSSFTLSSFWCVVVVVLLNVHTYKYIPVIYIFQ